MFDHLVVIQHGMCAEPKEVSNVKKGLDNAFHGRLRIILADVNHGRTTDGVAAAGGRLAELVREEAPQKGGCISFIGHSMGGVIARWAIKILEEENWFISNDIHAANFITTASPHLGIADIGAFWRESASFFGSILGPTVQDLGLQTDVMTELTREAALRGLGRFARRALYGNRSDDVGVRPCTSLMLPSRPQKTDMKAGIPHAIPASHVRMVFESADLKDNFPDQHIPIVRKMLEKLDTLTWERCIVHFPYSRSLGWPGGAHHKICNHGSWDPHNCGADVISHICRGFVVDVPSSMRPATHTTECTMISFGSKLGLVAGFNIKPAASLVPLVVIVSQHYML